MPTTPPAFDPIEPPPPTTRDGLLADATALGHPITERRLDTMTALGLLGSPQIVSLGRGHGTDRAQYSPQQRVMFRGIIRNQTLHPGIRDRVLAVLAVHGWLYWGEDLVDLTQLRRAARTAVGDPRRSLADAERMARRLIDSIDLHSASHSARARLRNELKAQLNVGRIDPDRLRPAVAGVFEPQGIPIVRGPVQAPIAVDPIVGILHAKMAAVRAIRSDQITDEAWRAVHDEHATDRARYAELQQRWSGQLAGDLDALYPPAPNALSPDESLNIVLLLLGLGALNPAGRLPRAP